MPLAGSSPTTFDAHPIMATNPSPDGLAKPQRTLAFATVMLAVTMAVLDGSIVNVALPSIAADQAVSPAHAIWVVTAYQLSIVVSLLPLAALGEAVGFRKIYLAGILLFASASVLCAEAPTIEVLVGARVIQGLGAAAIMSINSALVRHIMPRDRLGRGISWVAMTVAVSAAAGPTIAAAILSAASWHWLFLINVIPGVIVAFAVWASPPIDKPNRGLLKGFDILGLAAMAVFLGSLEYVLEEGPGDDWFDDGTITVLAVASVIGAVIFFWRSVTYRNPIVD
ncbi:MAG: MFS transporter, partial [Myxococcales bacterium]|nr:MFS transporter [Myxococcales bacterium]